MILALTLLVSVFSFSQEKGFKRLDMTSMYVISEEPWGSDTSYFIQQFVVDFKEMLYLHVARGNGETISNLYDIHDYKYNKTSDGYLLIVRNQYGEDDQMVVSLSPKGNFTLRVGNHTTSGVYTLSFDK